MKPLRSLMVVSGCLAGGLWALPLRLGVVSGESMAPTFHNGEVFVMSRTAREVRVARGDTVIFELHGQVYIKRVLALPGETVWGVDSSEIEGYPDQLLKPEEVSRIRDVTRHSPGVGRVVHVHVPPGHIFVVGDAETASYDSRNFGPIPLSAIRGRVVGSITGRLTSALRMGQVAYAKDGAHWRRPLRWRTPHPATLRRSVQTSLQ
jgi:signal peptidase I